MSRLQSLVLIATLSLPCFLPASFVSPVSKKYDTSLFIQQNKAKQQKTTDGLAKSVLREYEKCLKAAVHNHDAQQMCREQVSNFAVIIQKKF